MNRKLESTFSLPGIKAVRSIRMGNTLRVFAAGSQEGLDSMEHGIERAIRRALLRGDSVAENGIEKHLNFVPVPNPHFQEGKSRPSDRYLWDKTGNRVLVERILVIRRPGGSPTTKPYGYAYLPASEVL